MEAEYKAQIESELARAGPDAALRLERKIAPHPDELHGVLM